MMFSIWYANSKEESCTCCIKLETLPFKSFCRLFSSEFVISDTVDSLVSQDMFSVFSDASIAKSRAAVQLPDATPHITVHVIRTVTAKITAMVALMETVHSSVMLKKKHKKKDKRQRTREKKSDFSIQYLKQVQKLEEEMETNNYLSNRQAVHSNSWRVSLSLINDSDKFSRSGVVIDWT